MSPSTSPSQLILNQGAFARDLARTLLHAEQHGLLLTLGEAWRSQEVQELYYKTGRTKTLTSRHGLRLAVDVNAYDLRDGGRLLWAEPDRYAADCARFKPVADYFVGLDPLNVWGADWDRDGDVLDHTFRDPYHLERKP